MCYDERNINYITADKYVAKNDCKTEVNSESGNKKPKFLFLSPDPQFILDKQNTKQIFS